MKICDVEMLMFYLTFSQFFVLSSKRKCSLSSTSLLHCCHISHTVSFPMGVWGFIPILSPLFRTVKVPNPAILTIFPWARFSLRVSIKSSTISEALFLESHVWFLSYSFCAMSHFVIIIPAIVFFFLAQCGRSLCRNLQ